MKIDSDCKIDVILLAPHDQLNAVTENTDVIGRDAAIVSAGATHVPISENVLPGVTTIK